VNFDGVRLEKAMDTVKWREDDELREKMSEIIREHGLSSTGLEQGLARTIGCERRVETGRSFEVVNNDSVEEYRSLESDRFGLIVTSIPFGNHYEYSASYNDFGHNTDNEAFFRQMDFLTPELLRTLKPGRVAAIHVKDRIRFGNVTGYGMPSVDPFHADCIAHYRRHGFVYFGMITVVTDVVRENNQTYRLSWTEQCKDGTKMGVGSPEYVLLFRKLPTDTSRGYADERVTKSKDEYTLGRWQLDAHAFWRSSGDRLLTADELASYGPDVIGRLFKRFSLENVYDYEQHVKLAEALDDRGALPRTFMCLQPASHHPDVWDDVTRMRTLNGQQSQRGLTNHICPLQFDIVDRLITRYTNRGEEVSDPFGGLFTVPYRAISLGRRGHGVELNPEYFRDGLAYVRAAEQEAEMPTLFDVIREGAA
jgi:DNA modification methylase